MLALEQCGLEANYYSLSLQICDKIDNNNIGAGGCEHLSKADWKSLQTLYLRILTTTKRATRSKPKDVNISKDPVGNKLTHYTYVN